MNFHYTSAFPSSYFLLLGDKRKYAKKNAFFIDMDISVPRLAHNGLPRLP
jgi:hypothetical protein